MPNHIDSRLVIVGPKADVAQFQAFAEGVCRLWGDGPDVDTVLSEERFVPIPDDVYAAGFHPAGYDWCYREWGTKWGFYDVARHVVGGLLCYDFNTANSMALRLVTVMSRRFPDLSFVYGANDEGGNFVKVVVLRRGILVYSEAHLGIHEETRQIARFAALRRNGRLNKHRVMQIAKWCEWPN